MSALGPVPRRGPSAFVDMAEGGGAYRLVVDGLRSRLAGGDGGLPTDGKMVVPVDCAIFSLGLRNISIRTLLHVRSKDAGLTADVNSEDTR